MFFLAEQTNAQNLANLQEAGIVLILGMVVVFVFLALLVFSTKLMSKVLGKIVPAAPEKPAASPVVSVAPSAAGSNDGEIAAAICAAVVQSRK